MMPKSSAAVKPWFVAAVLVILRAPTCIGQQKLPVLSCPTYETTQDAREACVDADGVFLAWGQYVNGSETDSVWGNFTAQQMTVGPYQCDTCKSSGAGGFGYVGVLNDTIPLEVSTYYTTSLTLDHQIRYDNRTAVGTCPRRDTTDDFEPVSLSVKGMNEEISCAALQRHCQTSGNGWLLYAQTFNSEDGLYMCSGCDKGGLVHGTGEGEETNLTAWPMLLLYSMIALILMVAIYLDVKVFVKGGNSNRKQTEVNEAKSPYTTEEVVVNTQSLSERGSWYVLYILGYLDTNGKIIAWYSAICINRFRDLCCCRHRLEFAKFLSLLLVTLGVSVLYGDGQLSEYNCYFDATTTPGSNTEVSYARIFFKDFYGLNDRPEGGIPNGVYFDNPFDPSFIVAELVAASYQFSVDLLTGALSRGGYMKKGHSLLLMNILSAVFCAGAFVYEWYDLSMQMLYMRWITGFLFVLFMVGPFASVMSYILCKVLVATGCVSLPDQSETPGPAGGDDIDIEVPCEEPTISSAMVVKVTNTEDGTVTTTTTTTAYIQESTTGRVAPVKGTCIVPV